MKKQPLLCGMVLSILLFFSERAIAQNQVTGRITDSVGTAVANASISIKNFGGGTTTGTDGRFTVNLPSGATTLIISSIGFETREVMVNNQNTIDVVLQYASIDDLNEVVIIGYGTREKKDLTGAVTTINAKDFVKGVITTPEQLIAGKVAGVQITSNGGAPGAGSTIRIRGGASLNASNDPLIVIDGVPLDNGGISGSANALNLINPNDIESFNILKDAAATAIYGSRASNGVIIITTKKGAAGKPVFNFSTQFSVAQVTNTVEVLNADEFRALIAEKGNSNQQLQVGTANTNWQDLIYEPALAQDHNINVSGSIGNKLPYRVSAGFLNQDGILKTGNLKRGTASINLNPTLLDDHLKINLNLKGALSKNQFANEGAIGSAVIFDPTQPIHMEDHRFGGFFEWLNPSTLTPDPNAARNPLALLEMRDDQSTVQRSIGNIQFDYSMHFLPELRANLNLGYDLSKGEGTVFIPENAASQFLRKGTDNQYRQKKQNTLMEFYLNYAKDLDQLNSNIDLLAGYSYQDFLTTAYMFPDINAVGDTITRPNFTFDEPQNTLISYFGRLNYSYKGRYILTASLRRDGSSRFAPENRWGVFPAGAVAWNISQERFMANSRTLTNLKIRLGYGVTGQQQGIGNYDYISYFNLSTLTAQYQIGDSYFQMYRPGGYYADRKWEQTETYNAGLDFGFGSGIVSGSLDVYYKKTSDLLNEINQPAGTNFSNRIIANVGDMENRGIELSINTQLIRKANVSWDVDFNITYNQNKITNLTLAPDPTYPGNQIAGISGGTGNTIQINSVGHPRASFYVYQQVYDSTGKPLENLFINRNNDGTINENDLYQYKSPDPRVFLGFSTNVRIGKFNAGTVLRANIGNYVYNNVYSNLGRYNIVTGLGTFLNNASINYLDTRFEGGDVRQMLSDYYVQNASFLRMDNITLGYDAGRVFNAANLRVSANVQNVFVITKYKGLDPEISGGIDNNFYPRPRTFVLGLNLIF